jgi:acetyl-CoA carboxylase biotin carboxylase subunit
MPASDSDSSSTARPFEKVLVANRGEIARRVFRTCREHGIATVAVHSDADSAALHVFDADEAVEIGGAAARDSYLCIERIIAAAKSTGADAIHPGYGFLSERPALVDACASEGITFVGPPSRAMEVMGDKVAARQAMIAAGVPVVPGVEDLESAAAARAAAAEIGFPVMLKASAGGGGKGMRIVDEPARLESAFEAAAREAEAAFGDGRIFLERAVLRARHVEIQVMADAHGTVLHLGERDCSVQRRHQKVIEESPCPSAQMTEEVRQRMGEVATLAARAVDYRGAGTVEFLFEETANGPRFYFLEMNTRLQVEHPVTEAVTGRDLVWDQLRVAAGWPLGYQQDDVRLRGHAIECRIYAEDPIDFLPRPGRLALVRWPEAPDVRVDAAVGSGSVVSTHYDPMIAKVTVWGVDRASAIRRMLWALRSSVLLGIETNVPLHLRVLEESDFQEGVAVNTRYLDEHPAPTRPSDAADATWLEAVAAAAGARMARSVSARVGSVSGGDTRRGGAWRTTARWRR